MKPHQLAETYCDCHQGGRCLGITIADSGSLSRFRPEGSPCCITATAIERCRHFEQAVMPRKLESSDARIQARLNSEWNEGMHEYRIRTGYMAETVRICPQCRESKIGKGKKLCDTCRDKNRRETKSKSDHIRNAESNSHSSLNSGVDSQ